MAIEQHIPTTIKLQVKSETSPLEAVILGVAKDRPSIPHPNNPKIQEHTDKGTLPTEQGLIDDMNTFKKTLESHGVTVYRPENIPNQDQIFTRDIGFVIGDTFVMASMQKKNRQVEQEGIQEFVKKMDKVIEPPQEATVEGGDVLVHGKYIFVGLGERTNMEGVNFLKKHFEPEFEVIAFELVVSDDPMKNILHLDCTFQPVGDKYAIFFEDGFAARPDRLYEIFGEENLIKVSAQEMYDMFPNVFSISPEIVAVDSAFVRLIGELESRGLRVSPVKYREISKLGGLLRCSTLPLRRTES